MTNSTKARAKMTIANRGARLGMAGLASVFALAFAAAAHASTVGLDSGVSLDIQGDPNADQITVSTDGTTLTVVDTGTGGATSGGAPCAQVNATTVTCPVHPGNRTVDRFEVDLDNGVDSFTNTNFVTDNGHVHAGGTTGSKTVVGGPGGQEIDGGTADDNLSGGDGDDFLFDGGEGPGSLVPTGGNDLLDGGPGEDATSYRRSAGAPLSLTLDNIANDGQAGETDNLIAIEDIEGSDDNDTIVGDDGSNNLTGGDGDDVISGLGGNDELFGDFGGSPVLLARGLAVSTEVNDSLIGGVGRDGLDCGLGPDIGIRDPDDTVRANCERIGADVAGDSVGLGGKKKNKFKLAVACSEAEGTACAGKVKLFSNGKKIGKGKFNVEAGSTKSAKGKLTKKGAKAVKRAGGSLLVEAAAFTDEPGGISESSAQVLVYR